MKGGTWERTSWVAIAVFLMTASLILTKTGRDALFFQDEGLFDLPKAYIGIALLAGPTAFLTLFIMRRAGPRLARVIVPLVVATGLVWFSFEAQPGGGALMTLFFMAVPLVFGVMFSLSWLLAADLLDHLQGSEVARPYSAIGAASIVGGILGGLSARILAPRIEPPLFLILGGLTLAASALVMMAAQSRYPIRPAAADARTGPPEPHPIRALMGQRYVVILALIAIAGSLTGVLIEFQFFLAAASSGNTGQENAALFANLYTVLNAGALLVQLLLVPELQKWIGVGGSLLVLPGALVAGTTAMLASSSVLARSALRAAEGGLKSSVHRSNWEQAFLPIASAGRSIAKVLIDGLGARLGEGLAAGVLFVWLAGLDSADLVDLNTTWLNILLVGVALTWLGLSRRLGSLMDAAPARADEESARRWEVPIPDS